MCVSNCRAMHPRRQCSSFTYCAGCSLPSWQLGAGRGSTAQVVMCNLAICHQGCRSAGLWHVKGHLVWTRPQPAPIRGSLRSPFNYSTPPNTLAGQQRARSQTLQHRTAIPHLNTVPPRQTRQPSSLAGLQHSAPVLSINFPEKVVSRQSSLRGADSRTVTSPPAW